MMDRKFFSRHRIGDPISNDQSDRQPQLNYPKRMMVAERCRVRWRPTCSDWLRSDASEDHSVIGLAEKGSGREFLRPNGRVHPEDASDLKSFGDSSRASFRLCRRLAAIGSAIVTALASATPAHADPFPRPPSPFPDMAFIRAYYSEIGADQFFIPDHYGVWFLTPTGVSCGIWDRGGFGCSGTIPGAPAGDDHIAWFNGNRAVHHGWTAALQFPPGQAQRPLSPERYVTFNSTTCAVMSSSDTYCEHGEFKLMMTQAGTWYKAWDDRESYACLSYGTC